MSNDNAVHDFKVVAVAPADEEESDQLAVTLTDERGGKVRLHLPDDLAETLRERLTMAITKRQGSVNP